MFDPCGAVALPDVSGMSNAEAAQAYARHNLPVVPVRFGTKNPGSYLGKGWPQRATTDLDTVRDWWERWPDAGIAIHVGGAGLLVIDVDDESRVPRWLWKHLDKALFRPTTNNPASRRGHYFYRLGDGQLFGNGLGSLGKGWGEVRCYGGCVVVGPTHHPRFAEGGRYACGPAGTIPLVPAEIAQKLNAPPERGQYEPLTPVDVEKRAKDYLTTYTANRDPNKLRPILAGFDAAPGGRHGSMYDTLCWAMREAKAGCFPAQHAADTLRDVWQAAIGGEYRAGDVDEFDRMLRDAIHVADNDGTVDELWDRAHRDVWPSPMKPQRVAMQVVERATGARRPIAFWRGDWYVWRGNCWAPTTDTAMRHDLYNTLRDARYEKVKDGETAYVPWDPDKPKIDKVIDALKAEALMPDERAEDTWTDGRAERVIPFTNGLLRVRDRELLPQTPDYFNTEYLAFDYAPDAALSEVGRKFLDDLTGCDADTIETLLAFLGTRLVNDNRFQRMLVVIGPSGSGKGTFDKVCERLLGRRHGGMRLDDYKHNGFPTEPLLGKSLMTFSDQRAQLNMKAFVDLLLQVLGGDKITIRIPYAKRSMDTRLPLSFMLLSNEVPVLPDNAGAMLRRVLMISTPNSFVGREDFDLLDKLVLELPAFVNASLDAYDRLCKRGYFIQPESGRELLEILRENSSYLGQFVDECCDVAPDLFVSKAELYERWKAWCTTKGHTPTADNKFASDLYSLYLPDHQKVTQSKRMVDGTRVPCFDGLTLKQRNLTLRVVGDD